jgi:hypothetical protein
MGSVAAAVLDGSVTDFYRIQAGTIPGFAEAGGGKFMSVTGLPDRTVRSIVTFMGKLRGMHQPDPAGVRGVRTARPQSRTSAARRVTLIRGMTPPIDASTPWCSQPRR